MAAIVHVTLIVVSLVCGAHAFAAASSSVRISSRRKPDALSVPIFLPSSPCSRSRTSSRIVASSIPSASNVELATFYVQYAAAINPVVAVLVVSVLQNVGTIFPKEEVQEELLESYLSAFVAAVDATSAAQNASTSARFDVMDARFDVMDARFDVIDARFHAQNASTSARFDVIDARFDVIDARFDAQNASTSARFDVIDARLAAQNSKLDVLIDGIVPAVDAIFDRAAGQDFESASIKVLAVTTDPASSLITSVKFGLGDDIERALATRYGATRIEVLAIPGENVIYVVGTVTRSASNGGQHAPKLLQRVWVADTTILALPSHARFGQLIEHRAEGEVARWTVAIIA